MASRRLSVSIATISLFAAMLLVAAFRTHLAGSEVSTSLAAPVLPEGWITHQSQDGTYSLGYDPDWTIAHQSGSLVAFGVPGPGVLMIMHRDLPFDLHQDEGHLLRDIASFWSHMLQGQGSIALKDSGTWNDGVYGGYFIDLVRGTRTREGSVYDTVVVIPTQGSQGFMVWHSRRQPHTPSASERELLQQVCKSLRTDGPAISTPLTQVPDAIEDEAGPTKGAPQNAMAYSRGGLAHYTLGEYQQAIEDYDRAIDIDPQYAEAYNNRGRAFYMLGEDHQAIEDFGWAIEIAPQYAEPYNNRGVAYSMLGEYRDATEDFARAIDIDPQYAEPYYNRGCAYQRLGDRGKAIADFRHFLELSVDTYWRVQAKGALKMLEVK